MDIIQQKSLRAIIILLGIFFFANVAHTAEVYQYSFSVVPQQNTMVTQRNWAPFLKVLSEKTSMKFKLNIARSIPDFEVSMLQGQNDFIYMNPYHAILAKHKLGYKPLVRSGANKLHGILVVRDDSDITHVSQLNNKEVVFPSPNSFGASLLIRSLLHRKFSINIVPRYVDTHANVYRNVLYKKTFAGGGINKTLQQEHVGLQKTLRVLYKTPGSAPNPISVHPRVPNVLAERVQQAVIDMWKNKNERALLESVQLSKPMIANYLLDYEPLEELGFEKYVQHHTY